jgi:predicted Co/Zn/Cd cation transporter (cation efflux family)
LIASSLGNVFIGCVGVICAAFSSSEAIMLDGLFNLIYFATGLFTLKVARMVLQTDDDRFPYGYMFFEPLVNLIKGMLVFGVSVMAFIGAVQAFAAGGRPIVAGLAIAYGVFADLVVGRGHPDRHCSRAAAEGLRRRNPGPV